MLSDELQSTIERAKAEVLWDMKRGMVPASVDNFSDLHDYVDANGYGGAFDGDGHDVHDADFWNAVQDAVDDWLRDRRPKGGR